MKNLFRNKPDIVVFFVFLFLGFIAYRSTFGIYIPADNYYTFFLFEKHGLRGIIESIRITQPYLVSTPLLFFLFKLFGLNSFCWIGFSVFLHVINSFLVYFLCSGLQKLFFSQSKKGVSFFSGLLFLLSPYQTEAVLWSPTDFVILVSTSFILIACSFLSCYFNYKKSLHLLLFHFSFLFAVFSFESTFFFPAVSLLLFLSLRVKNETLISFKHFLLKIFIPQIAFIFTYFLLCRLWYGHWLWHDESLHIAISPVLYVGTFLKYLAKFFILYRYLPLTEMDFILREQYSNLFFIFILFTSFGILLTIAVYLLRKKNEIVFLEFIFLSFVFSLVPVLPLDASFLKYIYPDRYGYLPSVFAYFFLTTLLFSIFKKMAAPILCGITILFWILLSQTIAIWNEVNDYCKLVIGNYQSMLKYNNVYILGIPSYYKGIAALRSDFPTTIFFNHGQPSSLGNINVIAGYYYESASDSISDVSFISDTIKVIGQTKKSSFFGYYGSWARSYETEEYKVIFDSTGCSYTLLLKQGIPENSAFIYISNGEWRKANYHAIF